MSGDAITRLTLGIEDGGRTVPVPVGAEIELRLPENPTTGLRWSVPEHDVLELLDDGNEQGGEGIGAAGHRVLILKARTAGTVRLQMRRARQWDAEATQDATFVLQLVIE